MTRLQHLFADLFGLSASDITPMTSPETLADWDSIKHLQLMLMLEEEFHLQVSPEMMEQLTSVERIAAWLEEHAAARELQA